MIKKTDIQRLPVPSVTLKGDFFCLMGIFLVVPCLRISFHIFLGHHKKRKGEVFKYRQRRRQRDQKYINDRRRTKKS